MDAVSNVSVFGSSHRVSYPGGGADGHLDWGYPSPRGTAPGDKGFNDFEDLDELMTYFGIESIADVMAAREEYFHNQPTMNYWMTTGEVQTGLHCERLSRRLVSNAQACVHALAANTEQNAPTHAHARPGHSPKLSCLG